MTIPLGDFSFKTRERSLQRFREESFDLLVIGGGITGAAVARDAVSRGLSVALVERRDFAFGTSSRSSKLIHGGLRYLENFEFGLVFESLSERALLLKTVPHMVRPLPFYMPVYEGDSNGRAILSMGLWLYDILALFRTPGFHRGLSQSEILNDIPFLKKEGLKGGFRYFDASMWDDVLAVETLRSAAAGGAAIANYVEAVEPIWQNDRVSGFVVKDREQSSGRDSHDSGIIHLKAHKTVVCAGPWVDQVGEKLSKNWRPWLNPSKGVHLLFDLKKIPVPGAMVMNHVEDKRIAFVIPRPDYGTGVVIVGTTDGPTPADPEKAEVQPEDIQYLMGLLAKYFPDLKLTEADIISAYVGVRPLMGSFTNLAGSEGQEGDSSPLQKVSREHHIDRGPGGTVIVAGGKYTTHRKMAEEIVDFTLKTWKEECRTNPELTFPAKVKRSNTRSAVNPSATAEAVEKCREKATSRNINLPEKLIDRYGGEVLSVLEIQNQMGTLKIQDSNKAQEDPAGFPFLQAQLRHTIRSEMVIHLEDFYLRRIPLYASRQDQGLPWANALAQVWAQERGLGEQDVADELEKLKKELVYRSSWRK